MTTPPPILLLTRPLAQAEGFARDVIARHGPVTVILSPLVEIRCTAPVPDLHGHDAVIFSSQNGVQCFGAVPTDRRLPAYCVGPGTTQAAAESGFAAVQCGANAQELVATLLAKRPAGRFLHLRGEHARGAVAETLAESGLPCDDHVLYAQAPRPPSPEMQAALAGETAVVLPLFSPRSARLAGDAAQGARAPLFVVFMSAAVEQAWAGPRPPFSCIALRPDGAAMLDAVEGAIAAVRRLEGGASAS